MVGDAKGVTFIRIASVYMVAGLGMGIFMGISQDFRLASVHSHVALLGWVTLALTGLIYLVRPEWSRGALAAAHFWLHNAGLPVMVVSLGLVAYGHERAEPFIGVGATLVFVALGLFAARVMLPAARGGVVTSGTPMREEVADR